MTLHNPIISQYLTSHHQFAMLCDFSVFDSSILSQDLDDIHGFYGFYEFRHNINDIFDVRGCEHTPIA